MMTTSVTSLKFQSLFFIFFSLSCENLPINTTLKKKKILVFCWKILSPIYLPPLQQVLLIAWEGKFSQRVLCLMNNCENSNEKNRKFVKNEEKENIQVLSDNKNLTEN